MTLRLRVAFAALASLVFITGCGDTFRPIATPITSGGGDPQLRRHGIVISTNGPTAPGASTHVNISGDTNAGQITLGQDPVHVALLSNGGITYVVNRGGTPSAGNTPKPSITVYNTFTQPTSPDIPLVATLPDDSDPVYVHTSTVMVMVAFSGRNTVGVLIPGQNTLIDQIVTGTTPVAITSLPNQSKFYVANQGSNDVTVIRGDRTVAATVPVGAAPSYLVASADNSRVYVLNRGGNSVSVIDASNDTVISTIPVGAAPNFAVFDARNLRVYVTNSGGNTVSVINADVNSPSYLAVTSVTVGNAPVSLTVLADGSRIYVANSGSNSLSVLNGLNNTVLTTINLNGLRPVSLGSSADSTKVTVAAQDTVPVSATHADASAILNIRTSDQAITTVAAPFASSTCTNPAPSAQCARMRPLWVVVTP